MNGRAIWLLGVSLAAVMLAANADAAGKNAAADDDIGTAGPSVNTFSDAVMLVTTNAKGDLTEASVRSSSSAYALLTNNVSNKILSDWVKFNDRLVDVKGEISQVNGKLALKVVGPIKDVSPSLRGGIIAVSMDEAKKNILSISYTPPDGSYYMIQTNGMPAGVLRALPPMNGKNVDIEGTLSSSRKLIVDVRSIKVGKAPGESRKNRGKKK